MYNTYNSHTNNIIANIFFFSSIKISIKACYTTNKFTNVQYSFRTKRIMTGSLTKYDDSIANASSTLLALR